MPQSYNEDLLFRAIWMKEFLGYSIYLVAATPHMSPKTIQHYVLKCLNTEEVENFTRPKNSFIIHPHVEFVIMEVVPLPKEYSLCPRLLFGIVACTFVLFPTTFLEIAVYYSSACYAG